MKEQDKIKELFSEKLGAFEAPVRPELWANIASQVATTGTAATGLSIVSKLIIGISAAGLVAAGSIYFMGNSEPSNPEKTTIRTAQNPIEKTEKSEEIEVVEKTETTNTVINTAVTDHEVAPSQLNDEPIDQEMVEENFIIELEQKESPLQVDLTNIDSQVKQQNKENIILKKDPIVVIEEPTELEISDPIEQAESNYKIGVLPNIFTPNNDGENDFFFISNEGLVDFQIVVLNTNNQVIFQSKDPHFKWDGIGIDGKSVAPGQYYYIVTARSESGESINKYNSLNITR